MLIKLLNKLDLKLQINFMNKHNYDFTYTDYRTFGLRKKFIKSPKTFTFKEFIYNTFSYMAFKRETIIRVNFTGVQHTFHLQLLPCVQN